MKNILKILLLLISFLIFSTSTAFYSQDDLNNAYNKLKLVKSWDKYINSIDLIIAKYGKNEEILVKLESRLNEIDQILVWKTDKRSRDLKTLLDYLNIKVFFALDNILEEIKQIEEEAKNDEENSQDDNMQEDLIYPGFSTNYNDKIKTILAWKEEFIYAWWVWALYEKADVREVVFYITWDNISDLKSSIWEAYLYVEWLLLKKATSSDIDIISSTKASITFDKLNDFILPDDGQVDFRLSIKSNIIWYQNLWKVMKDLIVSDVDFDDVVWLTSDQRISNINMTNFSSEYFTISPANVTIWIIKNLNTSTQVELNIKSTFWNNTIETSNSEPKINLNTLKFSVFWNDSSIATYELYNIDNSTDTIIWTYNWWLLEFDLSTMNVQNKTIWSSSWENYRISISWINTWISMELLRDWLIYDVNWITNSIWLNANLINSIDLGYRDF